MYEINQLQNELPEINEIDENVTEIKEIKGNKKKHETFHYDNESYKLKFLIEDMFLIHFFP